MSMPLRDIANSTSPVLLAATTIAIFFLICQSYSFITAPDPLAEFEWAGLKRESFAKWRANVRSLTNMRETMLEGYKKVETSTHILSTALTMT